MQTDYPKKPLKPRVRGKSPEEENGQSGWITFSPHWPIEERLRNVLTPCPWTEDGEKFFGPPRHHKVEKDLSKYGFY